MNELRIIKRYQNRKLYDTQRSSYVTLEEIAQIIRDGGEIKVIDNKSKRDITFITQIQLLSEVERKTVTAEETELLNRVIRSRAGTFSGYIRTLEQNLAGEMPAEAQVDAPTMATPAMANSVMTPSTRIEEVGTTLN